MTSTPTKPEPPRPPAARGRPSSPHPPQQAPQQPQHSQPEQPPKSKSGLRGVLALPGEAARKVAYASTTSPGRLSLIATSLVALSLLVGLIAAVVVQEKSDTVTDLIDRREPLASASQQVYRALSDADATAASAFLSTGEEPPPLRERYENDIAQAGVFLAKATSDTSSGPEVVKQMDIVAKHLPVYTELIGTARANNRQGFPAGASYLREASELMQSKILPAAEELYRAETKALQQRQDDAQGFPWITTLLVLGLLAALIAAQLYLKRKTNRVFNVGLVVATGAIVLGLLWSSVALIAQSVLISSSASNGSEQVDRLVQARIAGLKARADETLTLVSRGDGDKYEDEFVAMSGTMAGKDGAGGLIQRARANAEEGPLAEQLDRAQQSASAWMKAHAEVRKLETEGSYDKAVDLAINEKNKNGTATAFLQLDGDLRSAIQQGRQAFFDNASSASSAMTLLSFGWLALGIVAALGVGVGFHERLREYR